MGAFLLTLLAGFHGGFYLLATPLVAVAFLVEQWEERVHNPLPLWVHWLLSPFLLIVLFMTTYFFWEVFIAEPSQESGSPHAILTNLMLVLIALIPMCIEIGKGSHAGSPFKSFDRIYFGIISLSLLGTAMAWDQRSSWVKNIDEASVPPASLSEILPQGRSIYWEGDLTIPWFLLRRSSYFSCSQGTGSLFSRETALNYWRRYRSFQPLHTVEFSADKTFCTSLLSEGASGPPSQEQVEKVCHENPGLGGMVLLHAVAGMHPKTWNSPTPFRYQKVFDHNKRWVTTNLFYVYDCPVQK